MDQKTEVQQRRGDKLEWGPGRCCSRKKMTSRYYFLSFEQKSPILSSFQNISTFSHTRISDAYGNIYARPPAIPRFARKLTKNRKILRLRGSCRESECTTHNVLPPNDHS